MRTTCTHAYHMSKMIQIRNVPDDLHRKLKIRAVQAGKSLSDYLLGEVRQIAEQATVEDIYERLQGLAPVVVKERPAAVIRRERDRR
jgi:plasmid stability protein